MCVHKVDRRRISGSEKYSTNVRDKKLGWLFRLKKYATTTNALNHQTS